MGHLLSQSLHLSTGRGALRLAVGTNGFLLLHALLLALYFLAAYMFLRARAARRGRPSAYARGVLLASAAPVYFVWLTPELFNFSLGILGALPVELQGGRLRPMRPTRPAGGDAGCGAPPRRGPAPRRLGSRRSPSRPYVALVAPTLALGLVGGAQWKTSEPWRRSRVGIAALRAVRDEPCDHG